MKKFLAGFFAFFLLTGCGVPAVTPEPAPDVPPKPAASVSDSSRAPDTNSAAPVPSFSPLPLENAAIAAAADTIVAPILARKLAPVEEIRAAYRYLIEHVFFADPVGLDQWRYRSDPAVPPPYLENRALSPLFFGVGSCEDFAASLAVLLRRMGYPADYVSGLTISLRGDFVDHAWTVVKVDGNWYHLDPQLEQNVVRNGQLTYRYFLKDDKTMLADHRWGENLAAYWSGAITPETREQIHSSMTPPPCPKSYQPSPAPESVTLPPMPDLTEIRAEIDAEIAAYLRSHDPLPPLTLNITPPILALIPKTEEAGARQSCLAPASFLNDHSFPFNDPAPCSRVSRLTDCHITSDRTPATD